MRSELEIALRLDFMLARAADMARPLPSLTPGRRGQRARTLDRVSGAAASCPCRALLAHNGSVSIRRPTA